MRHLGKTAPFRGPHGEVVSGSIAEIAYFRLGGLDQWVMIRGESVANPPLILLHGGPGLSETGACARLGKTKVAIFGHFWGSALGMLYAARFPEKVAVYVGSRQIGDAAVGESASYAFALAEAQRLGKQRAFKKLRAIGPPPHTADELWTQRMTLSRLEGRMRPRALWKLGRAVLAGRESSILDLPGTMRGFRFSLGAMWTEVSRLNLTEL